MKLKKVLHALHGILVSPKVLALEGELAKTIGRAIIARLVTSGLVAASLAAGLTAYLK